MIRNMSKVLLLWRTRVVVMHFMRLEFVFAVVCDGYRTDCYVVSWSFQRL